MEWIGIIIAGVIIGLLGKFVAPATRDNTPLWLTIVCGILGVILGYIIVGLFSGDGIQIGGSTSGGVDWTRWIVSILCAAVLVMVAATVTSRNKT